MVFSPSLSAVLATTTAAAVFSSTILRVNGVTYPGVFTQFDTSGDLIPKVGELKLSWFSEDRWSDYLISPQEGDLVNIGQEDAKLYISIDDGDVEVLDVVLSASDSDSGFVQLDILQDRKLTVGQNFIIGDGADFALALVYIGKGASVSVGGDLVVGGNAAAYSSSNGSGNGNGALIMAAGTSSDLSVDGILRIGGSGVCGSGTLDLSAATKATVVATDLEVCDPQSRVVMGKGSILKLQADRRKEVKDMMSNEELVLVDAATEFFTEYRNGVTMVSVIDSPVGCPGDVDVLTQTGAVTAEFDRIYDSIHISEQNTTTVTVDLSQLWSREAHIDHIYYAYRQYAPNSRLQGWSGDIECYEKESVPFGSMKTPYDTITAACHALAPYAKLEICVVDDLDNGIVKPLISTTVAEVVPHCCLHKIDSAKPQSAVCYILDINCAPPTDGRCELGTGDETKEQAKRRLDVQLEFLRRV